MGLFGNFFWDLAEILLDLFYEKVKEIIKEKKAEKARIQKLERKGEYSKVKVDFIKNDRVIKKEKFDDVKDNGELYEGKIIY